MPDKRLIDADEVIRGMEQIMNSPWFKDDKYTLCVKKDAFHIVKNLCVDAAPTIDAVEVVHGRWVFDRPNHYKCSLCDAMWSGVARFMKFCPNCGMPMDGGAEG